MSARLPFTSMKFQTRFGRRLFCLRVSAQADGALISRAQQAVGRRKRGDEQKPPRTRPTAEETSQVQCRL